MLESLFSFLGRTAALGLLLLSPAFAQHDKALAESLFQAGRDLMAAGKPEQACPKFAESQQIGRAHV